MALQRCVHPDRTQAIVSAWKADGLTVGLVPTMGALHEGHLSLVRASVAENDRTVVSIYVNPTQFGPTEDLDAYPRRLDEDCRLAEKEDTDLAFCPTDEVIYPAGFSTHVVQDGLTGVLEGACRPGHFRGVLTVVCKLFSIVPADRAYFGRKDFQQTVVVRRMVRDLNMPVRIRVMPTVREADGLAMSSRNAYLNNEERRQARCLFEALSTARAAYEGGETDGDVVRSAMVEVIGRTPLARMEYAEVVDGETLGPLGVLTDRAVAVLAVRIGETRLIDNMPLVTESGSP